jgi:hypothetical protein
LAEPSLDDIFVNVVSESTASQDDSAVEVNHA